MRDVDGPDGDTEIGTGTTGGAGAAETGRRVRINGANARSAEDMLEWLRVVWLTPAMDALFTGPAGDRRRFLDRLVLAIDPGHGQRALDYEKAMRGRNRLLAEDSRDGAWFDAIEAQMAETGVAIAAARAEMVRLLAAMIDRLPDDGPFPQADIALAGALERQVGERPAVEVEERFAQRWPPAATATAPPGRTLDGPHRSDLVVRHRPEGMPAELCSTGEQKALLVGIVLSHARLTGEMSGTAPILLLDEIAAHLDPGRRAALFCDPRRTQLSGLHDRNRGGAVFQPRRARAVPDGRSRHGLRNRTAPDKVAASATMFRHDEHADAAALAAKSWNAMRATSCCPRSAAPASRS